MMPSLMAAIFRDVNQRLPTASEMEEFSDVLRESNSMLEIRDKMFQMGNKSIKKAITNLKVNDDFRQKVEDALEDLIDDLIHEIAHSIEENRTEIIYGDGLLKKEFLGKRERLFWILQSNDYKPYSKIRDSFVYDKEIDLYFYKEIGYETMWNIVTGLFPSPYSATSLREYFAIGFEEFYIGDRNSLKRDCPILFSKLKDLDFMED